MSMPEKKPTGAENVRWDLSILYSGVADPRIDADIDAWCAMAKAFHEKHRGKLVETLGEAIRDLVALKELSNRVGMYLFLMKSANTNDQAAQTKMLDAEKRLSDASADFLTFFEHELVDLDQTAVDALAAKDEIVRKHLPWVAHARVFKPHLLPPPVEAALTKRSPFGAHSWADFFDEVEADLEIEWKGAKVSLTELLHLFSESKDAEERAAALKAVHEVLGGHFHKYSARTLNTIVGAKEIEDRERGYAHPMDARNKENRVTDEVVEALHAAVRDVAGPLARRFYALKARLLGMERLRWSDRNAPLPFSDDSMTSWDDATALVVDAYESFSPTLARLVRKSFELKRVDAAHAKGKRGGAFNYSGRIAGVGSVSYTLLNYLGSNRDIMTVAHELGHCVHGILAAETQGELMMHVPMNFAETASIFGEMTTFEFLKKRVAAGGDKKALLAMLCGKIDDTLNSAMRQIGFSEFERRVHGARRRLSPEELDAIWLETTYPFYGKPGEVFTYEHVDRLWSYVGHFHSPFYVYAYAFGELLTQSLYAARERLGDRFEPLYLDLLRSGDTRNVVELLAPFGLDAASPTFWADGIRASLGTMVEEAEKLADEELAERK